MDNSSEIMGDGKVKDHSIRTTRAALQREQVEEHFLSSSLLYSEKRGCETNTSSSFRPAALLSASLTNPGSRHGSRGSE